MIFGIKLPEIFQSEAPKAPPLEKSAGGQMDMGTQRKKGGRINGSELQIPRTTGCDDRRRKVWWMTKESILDDFGEES